MFWLEVTHTEKNKGYKYKNKTVLTRNEVINTHNILTHTVASVLTCNKPSEEKEKIKSQEIFCSITNVFK